MTELLTLEEKKYLGKIGRYLGSFGMNYGNISFELDSDADGIYFDFIPPTFDNNYTAEIPQGLKPILEKIINYVSDKGLFGEIPNDVTIDYQSFEISIDRNSKEISLTHIYNYIEDGEQQNMEYEDIMDEWEKDGVFNMTEIPEDKYLLLKFNGGGDSGYIESSFESGQTVPSIIEDWCYQQLEENFGGWEINEGSQGEFEFFFDTKNVILSHSFNSTEGSSDTLWEEKF